MMPKERGTLPEAKEITVKFELGDAEECLKYIPPNLERARNKIIEALERARFWNYLRDCEHLEFTRADFHLTGLMTPAWHLYCKHPENKGGIEKVRIIGLSTEVRHKITGRCSKENCPLYEK